MTYFPFLPAGCEVTWYENTPLRHNEPNIKVWRHQIKASRLLWWIIKLQQFSSVGEVVFHTVQEGSQMVSMSVCYLHLHWLCKQQQGIIKRRRATQLININLDLRNVKRFIFWEEKWRKQRLSHNSDADFSSIDILISVSLLSQLTTQPLSSIK